MAVGVALLVVIERLRRVAAVIVSDIDFRVLLDARRLPNLLALTHAAAIAPALHLPHVLLLRRRVVAVVVVVVVVAVGNVVGQHDLAGVGSRVRKRYDKLFVRRGRRERQNVHFQFALQLPRVGGVDFLQRRPTAAVVERDAAVINRLLVLVDVVHVVENVLVVIVPQGDVVLLVVAGLGDLDIRRAARNRHHREHEITVLIIRVLTELLIS